MHGCKSHNIFRFFTNDVHDVIYAAGSPAGGRARMEGRAVSHLKPLVLPGGHARMEGRLPRVRMRRGNVLARCSHSSVRGQRTRGSRPSMRIRPPLDAQTLDGCRPARLNKEKTSHVILSFVSRSSCSSCPSWLSRHIRKEVAQRTVTRSERGMGIPSRRDGASNVLFRFVLSWRVSLLCDTGSATLIKERRCVDNF